MTKQQDNLNLAPRVSILEKGQEAIQKDLMSLSHSVKEQGQQLSQAILSLSSAQNTNYTALSEKIGTSKQADWPTLISAIGLIFLIVGGLMTHIYVQFSYVDREQVRIYHQLERLEDRAEEIPRLKALLDER